MDELDRACQMIEFIIDERQSSDVQSLRITAAEAMTHLESHRDYVRKLEKQVREAEAMLLVSTEKQERAS